MKTRLVELIPIFLLLISMLIGATIWASNQHIEIKEWTSKQDYVTKTQLSEVMKEQYVRKHEFAIVEQKLDNQDKNQERMMKAIDKLSLKVDNLISRRSR